MFPSGKLSTYCVTKITVSSGVPYCESNSSFEQHDIPPESQFRVWSYVMELMCYTNHTTRLCSSIPNGTAWL